MPIDRADDAYRMLDTAGATLGVLFEFPASAVPRRAVPAASAAKPVTGQPRLALIGAGAYAGGVLVPALRAAGAQLRTVVARGGVDAVALARRFGAEQAASDVESALADPAVDAVVIATRHDSHAALAAAALAAGKHVFVEKPLALTHAEIDAVETAHAQAGSRLLMVGFNRRFSPLTLRLKALLAPLKEPRAVVVTVNAGALPANHWTRDPAVGGGRIVGEGCHFVDLMMDLAGAPPMDVAGAALAGGDDRLSCVVRFADGSTGTLLYLSNGHAEFPKERIEVFCGGRVFRIDDFRRLEAFGGKGEALRRQDKGNAACAAAFVAAIRTGGPPPVAAVDLFASSRATLDLAAAVGPAR
jgi:predicted dehydrogenase